VEPNAWLIEAGIEHQLGRTQLMIKRPAFFHNDDFRCPRLGHEFDYILAHSIFSHCGAELIARGLREFRQVLAPRGLCVVTFLTTADPAATFQGKGWVYPDCVPYLPTAIDAMIERAGLVGVPIEWYHAGQTWYLLAHATPHLPRPAELAHLLGRTLERDLSRRERA
jgi:SAM-dependent methyltransferase